MLFNSVTYVQQPKMRKTTPATDQKERNTRKSPWKNHDEQLKKCLHEGSCFCVYYSDNIYINMLCVIGFMPQQLSKPSFWYRITMISISGNTRLTMISISGNNRCIGKSVSEAFCNLKTTSPMSSPTTNEVLSSA